MHAREVAAGIWRLPFESSTLPPFDHTNGWLIIDGGEAVLVDAGFRGPAGLVMLQDVLQVAGVRGLRAVWLTHTHNDHCEGLVSVVAAYPEAEVVVHAHEAERLHASLAPRSLAGDAELRVGGRVVRALHTPGHSPGHLAYVLEDAAWVFAGDLIAGEGSIWIGAPEGDVAAYLASLERVAQLRPRVLAPGHGAPRADAGAALTWAHEHRRQREEQVLGALRAIGAPRTVAQLRPEVYPRLDAGMGALAERTLMAHLAKLVDEARVVRSGVGEDATYRAAP